MTVSMNDLNWLPVLALVAFLAAATTATRTLSSESGGTIDPAIGSQVETDERRANDVQARLLTAIENTPETIREVQKLYKADRIRIVFMPDVDQAGNELETAIREHESEIAELRVAIQASALLYNAIDAHAVLVQDVVALDFDDEGNARVYVAGENGAR